MVKVHALHTYSSDGSSLPLSSVSRIIIYMIKIQNVLYCMWDVDIHYRPSYNSVRSIDLNDSLIKMI